MQLQKADWVHIGQWVQPVLSAWFWRNWGVNIPEGFPQMSGDIMVLHGHHLFRKSDLEKMDAFVKEAVRDPALRERCAQWVTQAHATAKNNAQRQYGTPEEELHALEESFAAIISPWLFFLLLDGSLTKELKGVCEKQNLAFDDIVQSLQPLEKSFVVQQHEEAQRLYRKIQTGKQIRSIQELEQTDSQLAEEIRTHVKRFAFCGVHHFVGSPYTVETFFANRAKAVDALPQTPKAIPAALHGYAEFAAIAMFARTHMAETSGMIQHAATPMLRSLDKTYALGEEGHLWRSGMELRNTLQSNPPSAEMVFQRKIKHGLIKLDGAASYVFGEEVETLLSKFIEQDIAQCTELKGSVACKGMARGKVKIVVRPEDLSKVEDGDIMVAPETSPDFLVGMKKAAAVITEVGGITSHAAIVSRELGIPCIIGVKQATRALKDNDLVEVDAENGIVRKL